MTDSPADLSGMGMEGSDAPDHRPMVQPMMDTVMGMDRPVDMRDRMNQMRHDGLLLENRSCPGPFSHASAGTGTVLEIVNNPRCRSLLAGAKHTRRTRGEGGLLNEVEQGEGSGSGTGWIGACSGATNPTQAVITWGKRNCQTRSVAEVSAAATP